MILLHQYWGIHQNNFASLPIVESYWQVHMSSWVFFTRLTRPVTCTRGSWFAGFPSDSFDLPSSCYNEMSIPPEDIMQCPGLVTRNNVSGSYILFIFPRSLLEVVTCANNGRHFQRVCYAEFSFFWDRQALSIQLLQPSEVFGTPPSPPAMLLVHHWTQPIKCLRYYCHR